jgi:hypothetical protein
MSTAMYGTKRPFRKLAIIGLGTSFALFVVVVALWAQKPKTRSDGWYVLTTFDLPQAGRLEIIANGDPETSWRAVSWDWLVESESADGGFLGVIETEVPVRRLSPRVIGVDEQTLAVYDENTGVLWGVFRVDSPGPRLLKRSEANSEEMPSKVGKLLGRGPLLWIPT